MSDPALRLNVALKGRYRVERELGEGGMATVYLADDLKHERKVALKVLKPELAAVVGAERFLAEIKVTANLQHPNILPLHDSGETEGFLFYVMPYVEGDTLKDRLDREHQLPVDDAVHIATDMAEALDYAHRQGVIHRDIKPANVLLLEGKPVISDFGIALAVGAAGGGRLTETGLSLGTPHYMSPEQAMGDQNVGPQTDTYALGCVLYEMLVGEPPFTGPNAHAVLGQIITSEAVSATEKRASIPSNVDAAIRKALEKLPADRFTSAQDFVGALGDEHFRYGELVTAGVGAGAGVWNRLTMTFAGLFALTLGWSLLRPEVRTTPEFPVTRSSIDLGDLSLRYLGEVSVSRDGSRFAVVGVNPPNGNLYWRNADEEHFRIIPGTESANYASFSPDGQSLVFGLQGGRALQRVAISGGAPQRVATIPSGPSTAGVHWGDDDNIVFTVSGGRGLYRVPATGGDYEILLEPSTLVRNPRLLPGGQAVIFTDPVSLSTHLLDVQTDSVRVLRAGAIDAVYVATGHLLYSDVSGTLWAIAFDPIDGEVLGEAVRMFDGLTKPEDHFARFSISQNGTVVYGAGVPNVAGARGEQRLLIMDLEGIENPLLLPPRGIGSVKWSPDRESVVYNSAQSGEPETHIYTYNVELGITPRQVTFEGRNVRPVFSPDGTRVTFASTREGTDGFDLFVKTFEDGAPARSIIALAGNQYPTQWPSDTLIVFESGDPSNLWMLDVSDPDNPREEEYLPSEADLYDIVVSRDGAFAAYGSNESGVDEVYIRSFPEPGARTPVSQGGGQFPIWSPDGNTVFYWTLPQPGGGQATFMAARMQREPMPVVLSTDSLFAGNYSQGNWDLHPDGDRLIVPHVVTQGTDLEVASREPERFIVVTNWFEELRQRMGN